MFDSIWLWEVAFLVAASKLLLKTLTTVGTVVLAYPNYFTVLNSPNQMLSPKHNILVRLSLFVRVDYRTHAYTLMKEMFVQMKSFLKGSFLFKIELVCLRNLCMCSKYPFPHIIPCRAMEGRHCTGAPSHTYRQSGLQSTCLWQENPEKHTGNVHTLTLAHIHAPTHAHLAWLCNNNSERGWIDRAVTHSELQRY